MAARNETTNLVLTLRLGILSKSVDKFQRFLSKRYFLYHRCHVHLDLYDPLALREFTAAWDLTHSNSSAGERRVPVGVPNVPSA